MPAPTETTAPQNHGDPGESMIVKAVQVVFFGGLTIQTQKSRREPLQQLKSPVATRQTRQGPQGEGQALSAILYLMLSRSPRVLVLEIS